MRKVTVTEKYRAVQEGKMAKREFVRQMRQEYPMYVSQFNGFDDSVQILKNRGLLFETNKDNKKAKQYDEKPALSYSLDALDRGIRYELQALGIQPHETTSLKADQYLEAEKRAKKNLEKDANHYINLISGESSHVDKHDKMKETKRGAKDKDTYNDLKKATLKEEVNEAGPSGFGTGQGRSKTISKGREERPDLKAKQAAAVKKAPKYVMKNGVPHKFDADGNLVPLKKVSEVSTLEDRLREALSDPAKLAATKAIKAKYPEVTAGILDIFFDMHGNDIEAGADPEDEFTQFFLHNFDVDEKKGTDHDGDGDVDSNDYLAARDKAIKKAMGKDVDEDQERDHNFYDNEEKAQQIMQIAKDAIALMDEQPGTGVKDAIEAVIEDMGVEEAAIPEKGISLADALERYSLGEILDTAAEFYTKEGEDDSAELSRQFARDFRDMLDDFDGGVKDSVNENRLKEAITSIIKKTLNENAINEAATNQLAEKLDQFGQYPGAQQVINQLENIVTEVESFYGKTRDKIQKIYDNIDTIENEEGLKIGVFIGPSIESAFLQDLRPVTKKGFTKDLQLPKAKQLDPATLAQARAAGDIEEAPEDDKQTVFTPNI